MFNNLQKNLVRGALTSKPYSFKYRSWETVFTFGYDWLDPIMPLVKVETRGNTIIRIVSALYWISDLIRFAYDGLKRQRLSQIVLLGGVLSPKGLFRLCFFFQALECKILNILGKETDIKNILYSKILLGTRYLGSCFDFKKINFTNEVNCSYFFINVNIRMESPVFFLELKKSKFFHYFWGCYLNSYSNFISFGSNIFSLLQVYKGTNKICQKPLKVIKEGLDLISPNQQDIGFLSKTFFGFCLRSSKFVFSYFCKDDSFYTNLFSIFSGVHGDRTASFSNLLIPVPAMFEIVNVFFDSNFFLKIQPKLLENNYKVMGDLFIIYFLLLNISRTKVSFSFSSFSLNFLIKDSQFLFKKFKEKITSNKFIDLFKSNAVGRASPILSLASKNLYFKKNYNK